MRAGVAIVDLPRGSVWEVTIEADHWWTAPLSIGAQGGAPTSVDAWRTADVHGRVAVARDTTRPAEITIAAESPPQASRPAEIRRGSTFSCPVAADGSFRCALPAVKLDLAIRAKGFAPHYLWDVVIDRSKRNDLPPVQLRKGASLLAWLDRDSAAQLSGVARAQIVRLAAPSPSATNARLSAPVAEGEFTKRGYVQLAPLPAGVYSLEVIAPGFARTAVSPVEIYEGKETVFRKPIELQRPIEVRITVDPPSDSDRKPWRVQIQRRAEFAQPGIDGSSRVVTDAAGTAVIAGQAPGRFRVEIQDSADNSVYHGILAFDHGPLSSQTIVINQIKVTGVVTMDGEGVPAQVWFGGRDGAVRIVKTADDEGRFAVSLPHAGAWLVATHLEPDIESVENVNVSATGGEVEIELSRNSVAGWVVDEDGARVAGANVSLAPEGVPTHVVARTNTAGAFQFRGVRSGKAAVSASSRDQRASSRSVSIQVPKKGDVTGLELRFVASRTIRGQVVSGGQAVTGAVVDIVTSRATSDVDGRFELTLAGDYRAPLTVAAPGRTFNVFHIPAGNAPLRLDIPPVGGTVVVEVSKGMSVFNLFQNGVAVPFNNLYHWVNAHGEQFPAPLRATLPNLAPGQYRACVGAATIPRCVEGILGTGGTLRLKIPDR